MTPARILVLGQSNVASHGETRLRPGHGLMYDRDQRRHLPLADPIPGGTGDGGSVWTRLAALVAERGGPPFTVLQFAQSGTGIDDWAPGGRCMRLFDETDGDPEVASTDLVVFHQGERDTLLETSYAHYRDVLKAVITHVRRRVPSPWLVCRASYRMGVTNPEVRRAQNDVIAGDEAVHAGPDTDRLGPPYRYDDTHFNDDGLKRFAEALDAAIVAISA